MKKLYVVLYDQVVAELIQESSGAKKLTYICDAPPPVLLSVALPYRHSPYPKKPTEAFIEGLIPESEAVRQALAREYELSSWKNPFAILEKIGLECAGAVQFVAPEELENLANNPGDLISVTEEQLEQRLQRLEGSPHKSWVMHRERWSLAGAQSKFALRFHNGQWYEATGAQPTTHIFKPGIHDFKDQALNEHLCLKTLGTLGLPVAHTEYQKFGESAAIVVERYDRISTDVGVFRLHQEDMCQATSTLPERKYESSRGPSALKIIELIRQVCPPEDAETFVQALIANYLLGAPDAHAKNYSLLHLPDGQIRLAPLYDIASGFPYTSLLSGDTADISQSNTHGIPGKNDGLEKAAMAIGGERRFGKVTSKHWTKFAQDAGLDEDRLRATVQYMAQNLPEVLRQVCREEAEAIGESDLIKRMRPSVEHLCETTLTMLSRDY